MLEALVGVMVTLKPVMSTFVDDVLEKVSVLVVLTTCNIAPAGCCTDVRILDCVKPDPSIVLIAMIVPYAQEPIELFEADTPIAAILM